MIQLDEKHMIILRVLAQQVTGITHTQLWKETDLNKGPFQDRLNDLREFKLIERDPPDADRERERGRPVYFKISSRGVKRLETENLLGEIRDYVENAYKDLIERSIEIGESKPLTGRVAFFVSKDLPICTIAHFPSTEQYEKLRPFLESRERRDGLGQLINRTIEFCASEKEGEVYADYESEKGAVFTMGYLSKEQSETMKKAIETGLFEKYWHIQKQLSNFAETMWIQLWKAFEDPRFLKEGHPIIIANGLRYNFSEKKFEFIPKAEVAASLKRATL